ncbi:STY4851/ECs_5259 family protein, partial [uncultured Mailhella sp.]|uniref:STY4851/ECs_5259 family protein n=1 Tax=uncultured Mailhella sp. TaxID=1981031 RepID=UPI0025D51567
AIRLALPGKSLLYPLTSRDNGIVIRLMDWQNALLEMLAMTSGLDARVSLDILFDGQKVAGWSVARYESSLIPEGTRALLALPAHGERPSQGYAMKALLLTHPELGLKVLEEETRENGTPSGAWELSEALDHPGPWLIFDDTEGTSLRPLLWTMDGEDETPRNALQAAVDGKDRASRQRAFVSCTAAMEHDLDAPEWSTLLALLSHVKHLPLSTLEIWHALIRSPRIMALLALHPGVSFQDITSRVDTELPFLWNFVSRQDWKEAAQAVKDYLGKIISGTMAVTFWQSHVQEILEALGSSCPSVNALLHIAVALPCYEKEREQNAALTTDKTEKILFRSKDCMMQTLLRAHADDEWPEAFDSLVNRERHDADIRRFLPFSQGPRNSVLGLPVLLTLQAFDPRTGFFSVPPDQDTIFHIREHIHFDAAWFEQASTFTACSCLAERFSIKES